MKSRRLLSLGSILLGLFAFMLVFAPRTFAATRTWTGGGGDSNISTAANWGGTAPVNGDDIVFTADTVPLNRFDVNNDTAVNFATITIQDTLGSFDGARAFTLGGNTYNVSSAIIDQVSNTPDPTIAANINLLADVTLMGPTMGFAPFLMIGDGTNPYTLTLGNHTLTIDRNLTLSVDSNVTTTGTGLITLSKVNGGAEILNADGLRGFSGTVELYGDTFSIAIVDPSLSYSWGLIHFLGGNINFDPSAANSTFNVPMTVTNGGAAGPGFGTEAISSWQGTNYGCVLGSAAADTTLTLSGDLTLASDLFVSTTQDCGKYMILKFTGNISGNYYVKHSDASEGQLILAGATNTSKTPNGTYAPDASTTTIAPATVDPSPYGVYRNKILVVNGSIGSVFVTKGGTLKGNGTTADVTLDGGTIAPGLSPGCLNTGDLTLNGSLDEEIGGTVACSGYDQIKVTGTVDVTGGTLNTILYNAYKPKAGESYVLISNDAADAVVGTFNGLPEGATFNQGGFVFKVTYKGGDGNDVVLSVVSVPAVPDTGFNTINAKPALDILVAAIAAMFIMFFGHEYAKSTKKD